MGKYEEYKQKLSDYQLGIGAIDTIKVGLHISGFPTFKGSEWAVWCSVTQDSFMFFLPPDLNRKNGDGVLVVGQIPRNSVNSINIEDKTQVQNVAAGKALLFGAAALFMKKEKVTGNMYLVFDWDNVEGTNTKTIFEIVGDNLMAMANDILNKLKPYTLPKAITLKADEKKCPFCAEVIKKEAKICRFCQSKLE